jgi:hypothetical protein
MTTAEPNQEQRSIVRRTLYCYAHERLVRTLHGLVDVREAAHAQAIEHGYHLGSFFLEEDSSGRAMQALIDTMARDGGAVALIVPHRGHLMPLGGAEEWQQFLEYLTGHPLVFTSRTP